MSGYKRNYQIANKMEKKFLFIVELALCLLQVYARGLPDSRIIHVQCMSMDKLFGVIARPASTTVDALNDVTLTCLSSSLVTPNGYTWYRINGDIPSSSSGQNTKTLKLHDVAPSDEGEYYCLASSFQHCARSNNVMVSVKALSCPSLSAPSNGVINCSLGDDGVPSCEDTCSFMCEIGYELTGSGTRTCHSNGSWSGSVATCSRITCPPLSDPSDGIINCSLGDDGVLSYGDTCSFMCDIGYELTGSGTRTCHSNGSWSGSVATCSRITCPLLSDPNNGMINCSLGDDGVPSYEDTCNFTCEIGYELSGSESRTCQINGIWSGSIAMCTRGIDMQVSFKHSNYTVNEGDGKVEPALVLSKRSPSDITVQVSCFDGSATGQYTTHFNAKETYASFNVLINLFKDSEAFICRIDLHSLPRNVTVGNCSQSTITILKSDNIKVSFKSPNYSVNQSVGKLEPVIHVHVVFSELPSTHIVVQVVCNNGSATGEDVHYSLNAQFNSEILFTIKISRVITSKGNKFICRISKSSLPRGVTVGKFDQTQIIFYWK